MASIRTACLLVAAMLVTAVGAAHVKPSVRLAEGVAPSMLEQTTPRQFVGWREEAQPRDGLVDPETQQLLDKVYNQVLSRTYVDSSGYRIMLSIVYVADQRASIVHKPEVCYPSHGFRIADNRRDALATAYGAIPVRRLATSIGTRSEPLTYWQTVGQKAIGGELQKRLVELGYGLSGRIPDGLLFRVSSIDSDTTRAYAMQDSFVRQLVAAVGPAERTRLAGLDQPETGNEASSVH